MIAEWTVQIKVVPEHIAYTTTYEIDDYNDFFNEETGENILQLLSDQVEAENPNVHVPEIPDDYNYFSHEAGKPVNSPMHVQYFDMVNAFGVDSSAYQFVKVNQIVAATVTYTGPFEHVGKVYQYIYEWIDAHGYTIAGDGRSVAIHGPWDRDDKEEYTLEVQVPITF